MSQPKPTTRRDRAKQEQKRREDIACQVNALRETCTQCGCDTGKPEETKDYWLMRKYRTQCLREEGTLVDRFAYRKAWMDQVMTAKYAFLRLPGEVSGQLVGLDAQDIDRVLTERIEGIIRTLADGSADARAGLNPDDKEPSEKPSTTK